MIEWGTPPEGRPREVAAPAAEPEALVRRFAHLEGDKYRYVPEWGHWMAWDGKVWRVDDRGMVRDTLEALAREFKVAPRVAAELERRARTALHAEPREWDFDPWLLNTPKGFIELKTGAFRESRTGSGRFTRMTGTALADPLDRHPPRLWQKFLADVTRGDAELAGYLKRLAGYLLTGTDVEQALFFILGAGANGKSVFLNTLFAVLGSYARAVPSELFLRSARAPKPMPELRGARLAGAHEVDPGRSWAEARLKALTGGDRGAEPRLSSGQTTAPKFLLIGNHLPDLSSVDEAIRRRLHIIPFNATVAPEERDPWLFDKLVAEQAAILWWMVEGCLEWQRQGLGRPAAVKEASEAYLESEDTLGRWLEACCVRDDGARTTHSELFQSWQAWAKRSGQFVGTDRQLFKQLAARGYRRYRWNDRGFEGIRVRSASAGSVGSVGSVGSGERVGSVGSVGIVGIVDSVGEMAEETIASD